MLAELYIYFIHKVLQRYDDNMFSAAHFVFLFEPDTVNISQFVTEDYKLVTLLTMLKRIEF